MKQHSFKLIATPRSFMLHHKNLFSSPLLPRCFLIPVPSHRIQPGRIKSSEGCNGAMTQALPPQTQFGLPQAGDFCPRVGILGSVLTNGPLSAGGAISYTTKGTMIIKERSFAKDLSARHITYASHFKATDEACLLSFGASSFFNSCHFSTAPLQKSSQLRGSE